MIDLYDQASELMGYPKKSSKSLLVKICFGIEDIKCFEKSDIREWSLYICNY